MIEKKDHKKDRYFPKQVPIHSYGLGEFHFAGMTQKGGLFSLPSGTYPWFFDKNRLLSLSDFRSFLSQIEQTEIFLIGTGSSSYDFSLKEDLKKRKISFEIMSTQAAIFTLNVLLAEGRSTSAALLPIF